MKQLAGHQRGGVQFPFKLKEEESALRCIYGINKMMVTIGRESRSITFEDEKIGKKSKNL